MHLARRRFKRFRGAGLPAKREAGAMTERRVIIDAPAEGGGRRVRVDGEVLGVAYGLRDLSVFLQRAGAEDVDEIDVADSPLIEWHGGGPEVWR
jgi:hypothetical protein